MYQMAYFRVLWILVILVMGIQTESEDFDLLIMHNNDMHARFEETAKRLSVCTEVDKKKKQCYGGFARTAYLVRKARDAAKQGKGPNVIYLNAGDSFTGTNWFSVHKSKIVTEFMNLLMPDVASFGNHEFYLGVDSLVSYINSAKYPLVAANLDFSNEPRMKEVHVPKSVILDIAGRRIGVIGYLLPETSRSPQAQSVIFNDELKSVIEESKKLDSQGVKIIIALGHSGVLTDLEIAKNAPLVDVVVGGHSHTLFWNGEQPDIEVPYGSYPLEVVQPSGKKVYVVQAYAFTKYMGYLNLIFNKNGDVVNCTGQPLLLNSDVNQDEEVLKHLEKFRPAVENMEKETVGITKVTLSGGFEHCRYKECNLGNLITDAFVEYYSSTHIGEFWTDAPLAVINGGTIRANVNTIHGAITRGNLMNAISFDDGVVAVTLQGADLLKTLENGVRYNGNSSRGEFLQTSGLNVVYDLSKPVGSRVIEARARCGKCAVPSYETVNPNEFYRVVTNGYIASGGDGHVAFKENGRDVHTLEASTIDVIVWYIKRLTKIHPEVGGRSTFLKQRPQHKTFSSKLVSAFRYLF